MVLMPLISAGSGLAGAWIGGHMTLRRDREGRHMEFVKAQLDEFYSPMLGIRAEIKAKSEARVRVRDAFGQLQVKADPSAQRFIEEKYGSTFEEMLKYDNEQLEKELLPLYRNMLEIFRQKAALAEESTMTHYLAFVEFVEVWNRRIQGSLPARVAEALGHGEAKLHPLYEDLETQLRALRAQLRHRRNA